MAHRANNPPFPLMAILSLLLFSACGNEPGSPLPLSDGTALTGIDEQNSDVVEPPTPPADPQQGDEEDVGAPPVSDPPADEPFENPGDEQDPVVDPPTPPADPPVDEPIEDASDDEVFDVAGAEAGSGRRLQGFQLGTGKGSQTTIDEITGLRLLGATLIRYPIYLSREGWSSIDVWLTELDPIQRACEQMDVTLVIVFLHPTANLPGSTILDEDAFVRNWRKVAQWALGRRRVWLELCNEPNHDRWRALATRAAKAIRDERCRAPIVVSVKGDRTTGLPGFEPLEGIDRQIVSVHFWNWKESVQDTDSVFNPYPYDVRTKRAMRDRLEAVKTWQRQYGVRVYISEVGIRDDHPNAAAFLRDFTSICDELRLPLTIHAFRESDYWNYEQNSEVWSVLQEWLAKP